MATHASKSGGHDHESASWFERRPIVTGIVVGTVRWRRTHFCRRKARGFAAVVVVLIAEVYFGFAVANGSPRDQFVEFNITGLFTVAGLLGLLFWPILLPLAYFGHALWDLAHHNRSRLSLVATPQWYVPWCIVIDVIIGAGLFVIWSQHGLI